MDTDSTSTAPGNAEDPTRTLNLAIASPGEPVANRQNSAPASVGRYRIIRLIGEGGMGAVYEAEQDKPRRIVALKVIKSSWADPGMVRRFEQESQALGRLQHPGIAQIYEAGTANTGSGLQPYFAMEFIAQGQPLTQYAETRRLDTRQRLGLMVEVCEAVHHAHQRSIIHRDLKPGNILADESGHTKILDFGVARVADRDAQVTRQTDIGQLVGTLAYMSPEQALADPLELDIRSDVYALGVILYELLAGKLPYQLSHKLHEAVVTIREQEPTALSSVSRIYRGDIETIVAKALEKDKTRRYNSAADLAADIRRYLKDEPIVARPATVSYQLRKFARRNKALVAGVTAVFVVLMAGIVASTFQTLRARRAEQAALVARDRATTAERSATKERDRALTAEQDANHERNSAVAAQAQATQERNNAVAEKQRANTEAATAKAVNDFLQNDLLAQASSSRQANPNTKPDADLKVRTALDRAAERIEGEFAGQPLVEASIRQTIGNTYRDLGLYAEAQRQVERALDLRRRVLGEEHRETLGSMNDLAALYWYQGKYSQAEVSYRQVLDARRRVLGEEHRETLATMYDLASTYDIEGKRAEAEVLDAKILKVQRRVLGEEHPDTLMTMNNLAAVYYAQGKYVDAAALFAKTLEIRRRLMGEEHPDTLAQMTNLGAAYRSQGRYTDAEALLTKVVQIERRVLGEQHPNTLFAMSNLGVVYSSQNKYAEAEALLTKVLEMRQRVLGGDHPNTLETMVRLGRLYEDQGKYAQAETLLTKALDARRRLLGENHSDTLQTMAAVARVYCDQGKYAEAEPVLRETVAGLEKLTPNSARLRFNSQSLLGASLAGQRKYAEAEPLLVSAYEGMIQQESTVFAADHSLEETGERIVKLYQSWAKPEKAAEWKQRLQETKLAGSPKRR